MISVLLGVAVITGMAPPDQRSFIEVVAGN